MKNKMSIIFLVLFVFILGFIVGGIIFRNKTDGTPITVKTSKNILKSSEITGLLSSVILNYSPGVIPNVIFETEKTIVVKHPFPEHKIHYLLFPKKDIKSIGAFSESDKDYIIDLHASLIEVLKIKNIKKYKILSNGSGRQHIAYLHFHLMAD